MLNLNGGISSCCSCRRQGKFMTWDTPSSSTAAWARSEPRWDSWRGTWSWTPAQARPARSSWRSRSSSDWRRADSTNQCRWCSHTAATTADNRRAPQSWDSCRTPDRPSSSPDAGRSSSSAACSAHTPGLLQISANVWSNRSKPNTTTTQGTPHPTLLRWWFPPL